MHDLFENGINETSIANSKMHIQAMVTEIMSNRMLCEALLRLTAHDYATYSHSVNVSIYALALAKELNLPENTMVQIGSGALLHDLGKSKIPSSIINKTDKLTLKEFQEMKKHPNLGHQLLVQSGETDSIILDIVKNHHEKCDGSGYNEGLTKDFIKLEVQIVTVADIFDALSTNRSYKVAASHFTSFKTMKVVMKDQIDMKLIDTLIVLMGKK